MRWMDNDGKSNEKDGNLLIGLMVGVIVDVNVNVIMMVIISKSR